VESGFYEKKKVKMAVLFILTFIENYIISR